MRACGRADNNVVSIASVCSGYDGGGGGISAQYCGRTLGTHVAISSSASAAQSGGDERRKQQTNHTTPSRCVPPWQYCNSSGQTKQLAACVCTAAAKQNGDEYCKASNADAALP
jgi:hypothetical protein